MSLLELAQCDILFHPTVDEMYGTDEQWHLDLGHLEHVLEGLHRPGHFQGVTQVLKKLFDAVQPDMACFGQKDFQQFQVVEYMVNQLKLPLTLALCPTVREPGGLAMSSRNVRFTLEGRRKAMQLSNILKPTQTDLPQKNIGPLSTKPTKKEQKSRA